ncbi:MAG TPA: GNAT family N-acetyltransferase [Clostridia bacterium]|nr:GNAT family N-acetyltransferase [Clostridia bacterium]
MVIKEVRDINIILSLHQEIFGKTFPISSYYKKCKINKLNIFVYEENSKLFGYSIIVDQQEEKNMYAWYGGVLPESQGKGITKKFLENLIEMATEKKYLSVTLASTNIRPHMLILAIKMGFNIDELKKRDYGEGNKIYFKYKIMSSHREDISLVENGRMLKLVEIEEKLVKAYKTNCIVIKFTNIENLKGILYAIKYCNSFSRKIEILIDSNGNSVQLEIIKMIEEYTGKVKII